MKVQTETIARNEHKIKSKHRKNMYYADSY